MARPQPQWDNEIARLYIREEMSLRLVAAEIGRSANFVRRRLSDMGIAIRGRGTGKKKPLTFDDDKIIELYHLDFRTAEIAEIRGWSPSYVRKRIRANGLKPKRICAERIPHEEITRIGFMYHRMMYDIPTIAKMEGRSIGWVRLRVSRVGPPRPKSEVSKMAAAKRRAYNASSSLVVNNDEKRRGSADRLAA